MNFEMPTKVDFENNGFELEENKELLNKGQNEGYIIPAFITTQNNVVIPTGKLIKTKSIDIRILACSK